MDDMVRLCFNDVKKLSLNFGQEFEENNQKINKEEELDAREIARRKLRREQH